MTQDLSLTWFGYIPKCFVLLLWSCLPQTSAWMQNSCLTPSTACRLVSSFHSTLLSAFSSTIPLFQWDFFLESIVVRKCSCQQLQCLLLLVLCCEHVVNFRHPWLVNCDALLSDLDVWNTGLVDHLISHEQRLKLWLRIWGSFVWHFFELFMFYQIVNIMELLNIPLKFIRHVWNS